MEEVLRLGPLTSTAKPGLSFDRVLGCPALRFPSPSGYFPVGSEGPTHIDSLLASDSGDAKQAVYDRKELASEIRQADSARTPVGEDLHK